MQSNTDEPGIGWTPGLGPFPALVDWRVRVADIDRDSVNTQVRSIAGPGGTVSSRGRGRALARLVRDRATEDAVRKHSGFFALLAALVPQDPLYVCG